MSKSELVRKLTVMLAVCGSKAGKIMRVEPTDTVVFGDAVGCLSAVIINSIVHALPDDVIEKIMEGKKEC